MKKQFILPRLFLLGSSFTACQVSNQAIDEKWLPTELMDETMKCMSTYNLERLQQGLPQRFYATADAAAVADRVLAKRQHYYALYRSYVDQFSTLTELRNWPDGTDENHLRAAAEALAYNRSITKIDLAFRSIGSKGAKALARALEKNSTITNIYLTGNSIGSCGAAALAKVLEKNSTITKIILWHNNIGSEGAKALAQALEKNSTITDISLAYNNVGSEGAKALAQALERNSTIINMDLSSSNIDCKGVKELATVLAKNSTIRYFSLHDNNVDFKGAIALAVAIINREVQLSTLNIYLDWSKTGITEEAARAMALEKINRERRPAQYNIL
ncbi:hypothetical protein [Candidatus Cardinium hertigii]|uniref:Uncharacterized protein n=1 Tax=Candidatus Cardinium hertigii TaxID=247481 RepID=A0A3N2QDA8_9BACT|nr:hypothetical protein [Candidatus Cardinium hertigii]ROT47770.1 hypothetical protein EDM02_00570 [Candidatus Cardinium hertigii]